MKKIIASILAGLIISLCVLIVLYSCGFRITYAPALENSWDAVSACASWFGAIMSALALWVAICIPKIIADQQNRIALFDKRYYAFSVLNFLISVAKEIIKDSKKEETDRADPWDVLASSMQTYSLTTTPFNEDIDFRKLKYFYSNLVFDAVKASFLFDKGKTEHLLSFLETFDNYVLQVCTGGPEEDDDKALQNAVEKIDTDNILQCLEEYLIL